MTIDRQAAAPRAKILKNIGVEAFPCEEKYWAEWKKCKDDPVYFIKTYGQTYDPRRGEGDRWIPFDLWGRQEELVKFWKSLEENQEGGLVEKSRDTGVSWCVVGYTAWRTVFYMDENTGLGAALEEQVDHPESEKAIMWKLRGFLDRLPQWMLPKGYRNTFKNLVNDNTGSRVEGQAGLQIGRGGRTGRYFIDEFAFVANSMAIIAAVAGNTNCLFPLSTPNGVGNAFQQMRDSLEDHRVFTFHWKDDPRKTQEWADKKKKEIGDALFAQEYDIDYTSSLENIVIDGEWVRAAVNFDKWCEENGKEFRATGPFLAGLDVGGSSKRPTTVTGIRQGPKFKGVVRFTGSDVDKVLGEVFEKLGSSTGKDGEKVVTVAFDAAGDHGAAASKSVSNRELPFKCVPIMGQKNPTKMVWPDGKRSDERFHNLRSELWWKVRERFRKTWETRFGESNHPIDECISIPDDPQLTRELSTPLLVPTDTNKKRVESKMQMRARGVKSPDSADCLVYTFAAEPPVKPRKSVFDGYKGASV